tara:strand:+ start:170 stop:292 length:123 start_codon:yes stop_codon:yes gene_type:complete
MEIVAKTQLPKEIENYLNQSISMEIVAKSQLPKNMENNLN